jgi:DNA-binding NarL/FixJ family response regulator
MSGDDLHGRGPERGLIAAALDAVARGDRRLLIVRGEAGIGKTRLLTELREQAAAQRFVVLDGRATELERDLPLVPIIDAITPRLPAADLLGPLGPQQLGLLAELLPGLAPAPSVRSSGAERWRLHRALGALLERIAAGRPLVLVIDDLHWADPATQELLEHLVRRPPADSLLIAVGARPGPAAERLLSAQRSGGAIGLVAIDLGPLPRTAAEALLSALPDDDRDRAFVQSGGNPLLLGELARAGRPGAVPEGIVAAIRAEAAALPQDAQALLRAAAVVGDPFAFDLAARIAELDGPAAYGALTAIVECTLVRPTADPRRFRFRHPVVRTAVYAGFGAGERLAAHATAAAELTRIGAHVTARAQHLAHAAATGDVAGARTLREAAAHVRPQAPGVAVDWLLAAGRADPAGIDIEVLFAALVDAGRLSAALELIDASGEAAQEPRIAVAAASVERQLGRHDSGRRRLIAALTVADGGPAAARVLADLAVAAYQRGNYPETREWAQQVGLAAAAAERDASGIATDGQAAGQDVAEDGRSARGGGAGVDDVANGALRAIAATLLAVGDAFAGDAAAAAAGIEEALAAFDAAGDEEIVAAAEPAMAISWGLLALDRPPDGLRVARRIAQAARHGGNDLAAIPHDLAAVLALLLLGRLVEAEPLADDAEAAARVSGNPQLVQWTLWLRASVLMERGRLDAALAAAQESVDRGVELDDSASAIVARAVLGTVLGLHGQHARGRELIAAYDIDHGWICRHAPSLVASDLALDDLAAAREHAERAAALAPRTGMAGARAAAGRARAMVTLADGDASAAAALALDAAEEAATAGANLEQARDRVLAGRALIVDDPAAAVTQLTVALELAGQCAAPRVEDEARQLLRRAGVRVGRRRVDRAGPQAGAQRVERAGRVGGDSPLAAISPRERDVAVLVADGLTNREIGARLYLSEKTVETHLTSVFRKLGVRSRAQVAAAMARAAP